MLWRFSLFDSWWSRLYFAAWLLRITSLLLLPLCSKLWLFVLNCNVSTVYDWRFFLFLLFGTLRWWLKLVCCCRSDLMHKLRTHFVTLTDTNATLSFEPRRNLCLTDLVFGLLQMLLQSLCFYRPRSVLTIAVVFCARQPLTLNKLSLDLHIIQMVTFLYFHVSLLFFLKYGGDGIVGIFKV